MPKCFICHKEKARLIDGMCEECLGGGANISLMSAINSNDKQLVSHLDNRVKQGKIIRLM
jgi:hypothetical protein